MLDLEEYWLDSFLGSKISTFLVKEMKISSILSIYTWEFSIIVLHVMKQPIS